MHAANGSNLPISGAIIARLTCPLTHRTTRQMVYITPQVSKLYLSREACTDLGIVTMTLPPQTTGITLTHGLATVTSSARTVHHIRQPSHTPTPATGDAPRAPVGPTPGTGRRVTHLTNPGKAPKVQPPDTPTDAPALAGPNHLLAQPAYRSPPQRRTGVNLRNTSNYSTRLAPSTRASTSLSP